MQILSELAHRFAERRPFAGLIFVDEETIPGSSFGALVRALIYLWDRERDAERAGRMVFLGPATST